MCFWRIENFRKKGTKEKKWSLPNTFAIMENLTKKTYPLFYLLALFSLGFVPVVAASVLPEEEVEGRVDTTVTGEGEATMESSLGKEKTMLRLLIEQEAEVGIIEGVKSIVQPGGSMRDWDVIDCCNEADVAMVFTGQRSFKH